MTTLENATFDRAMERRMIVRMSVICGLLIAVGIVGTISTSARTVHALSLGDVSQASFVEIRDHQGATVLSGEFRSRVDMLGNTEKDAALFDRRGEVVIGEVEIEIPSPTRENRRPELEVDVIGLTPRETFTIVIDDRIVASFSTDDRGSIDTELQEGEVPLPVSVR